ncbi:MAG: HD domain-containing protein [Candidatus Nanohaloarchaea archaeon]
MLEKRIVEELKQDLKQVFSDYYEAAGGKNFRYHHLVRTHKHVKKLMEKEEVRQKDFDEEVVEVAALFHDIGRKEDIEDGYLDPLEMHEGHAEKGAEIVSEYVSEYLSENQLKKVEEVIRNHHSEPETVEGMILQDCDALSNFGVNNLWRMIHYSAENERTLEGGIRYFWNEAVEEYQEKLEDFNFDVTRRVAEKRITDHQEAIRTIEEEINAEDI